MKVLGIEVKKNPFDRVSSDDRYYYTIVSSDVLRRVDINDRTDRRLYDAINYFSDKAFAEQVALHQLLYRQIQNKLTKLKKSRISNSFCM